VVKGGSAW